MPGASVRRRGMGNPERRTNRTQVENLCYGDEAARGCPRQKLVRAAFFSNLGVRRGVRYG
jgi:hypothetical protein